MDDIAAPAGQTPAEQNPHEHPSSQHDEQSGGHQQGGHQQSGHQHGLAGEAFDVDPDQWFSEDFWDRHYGSGTIWSGNPNPLLVRYAADLDPGTALDMGCGEGGDVLWLAGQGWTVTGADISQVALDGCAALAAAAGPDIAARTSWQQADAFSWQPPVGGYDLVSAQFVHLPRVALHDLHRRLAAAVRPGGTLLIVGHDPSDHDTSMQRPDLPDMFATAEDMAGVLDPEQWQIETSTPARQATDPDGNPVTIHDAVVRAVRRS